MGRYVYSKNPQIEYEYKFAFAAQSSNFGEVLEDAELKSLWLTRYTSECGEYVDLHIDDYSQTKKELSNLVENLEDQNDKIMIKELIESLPDEITESTLTFFVEY